MHVGLDRLPYLPQLVAELRAKRVGLLAHPASVSRFLLHAVDVLQGLGITPQVLFGPEHGWDGQAQDMVGVGHSSKVVSLYGDDYEDLSPRPEHLENLDVMLIDLQDVGARYYTFVWTAVLVARACAKKGIRVIVLDRPNPLGSVAIEGRLQAEGFLSFVGLEPIPVRHSLTIGELVLWRGKVEGYGDLITVVAAQGIDPAAHASAWDRPFVMPSPNMPTYESALVYPGGCLLEGTNLSDGRGTTRPFEITGAPWIDGKRLAADLEATALPGFIARAISFQPTFHKHEGRSCGGVQIHVTNPSEFRPMATYVALIALCHEQNPERFKFRTEKYEFVDNIPAFDILTGSADARERILAGEDSAREIADDASDPGDEGRAIIEGARGH